MKEQKYFFAKLLSLLSIETILFAVLVLINFGLFVFFLTLSAYSDAIFALLIMLFDGFMTTLFFNKDKVRKKREK